jgi:hypothetical protein
VPVVKIDSLVVDAREQGESILEKVAPAIPFHLERLRLSRGKRKLLKKPFLVKHHFHLWMHYPMPSTIGNALCRNAWLAAVFAAACGGAAAAGRPSAKEAPCLEKWASRMGPLREAIPSKMPGFKEMHAQDGNVIYVEKGCGRAFVGEIIPWQEASSLAGFERVERSRLDYASFVAIGLARPAASWILVAKSEDLAALRAAVQLRPQAEKAGFYLAVPPASEARGAGKACSFPKLDAALDEPAGKPCRASLEGWMSLAGEGTPTPFAIDRSGAKMPIVSWEAFFELAYAKGKAVSPR